MSKKTIECGSKKLNIFATLLDEELEKNISANKVIDLKKNIILNGVITNTSRILLMPEDSKFSIALYNDFDSVCKVNTIPYKTDIYNLQITEQDVCIIIDILKKYE
jgi:hypothetical protein